MPRLPTTTILELRSRLLRSLPLKVSTKRRETLGLIIHVYDETCHSSRSCFVSRHSCVMGIERFIARRGPPYVIRSDYGRNFVSSAKDLISCIANWNRHAHVQLAHEGRIWKLIHPVRLIVEKSVFHEILGTGKSR